MKRHHFFTTGIFGSYIILTTLLMIFLGIGITPDRYSFVLLIPVLFIKKTRRYILDWIPFLGLLITYDFLRSFSPFLNTHVNFTYPIQLDSRLFGFLPTLVLQKIGYQDGILHWYDYLAAFGYFFHFAIPMIFALILWLKKRAQFFEFTKGLLLLSYSAWLTFLAFPVAPPWLASENGYLSGVTKILDQVLKSFPERFNLPSLYNYLNPNSVAAIPSLHAAYPLIIFLFGLKFYGKKALFFLPYVFGVWLALIYLGEHYFTDIMLGGLYSILAYWSVEFLPKFRYLETRLPVLKPKPAFYSLVRRKS